MFLPDTNICVLLMKNRWPVAVQKLLGMNPSDITA